MPQEFAGALDDAEPLTSVDPQRRALVHVHGVRMSPPSRGGAAPAVYERCGQSHYGH